MHTNGVLPCTSCALKLEEAHHLLVGWFWDMKLVYPDLHISWAYRDEASQHADFLSGKSRLDYPNSKHNNTVDGKPLSLALDLFTIDSNGSANFNPDFYDKLNLASLEKGYSLRWGGTFQHLKDMDHWEILES